MLNKKKIIRFTAIALIVLIAFSFITAGLKTSSRRIYYGYKVDALPGSKHIVYRAGKVKLLQKPETASATSEKEVILNDTVVALENTVNNSGNFIPVRFSDNSKGWIELTEMNRNFYPEGRGKEVKFLNFMSQFGSFKMLLITALISLLISFLLFRFYSRINSIFDKKSRKVILKEEEPWFFMVAMIIGIAMGYLFFFYRGRTVQLIMDRSFLIPGVELENVILFLSFWGFVASVIILALKSIKTYSMSVGIWRTIFYIFLMIIILIANFFFTSAAIYILIILMLFLAGSSGKAAKITEDTKPKTCNVCGGQNGSHAMKCPNGHWSGRVMSTTDFYNMTYEERNS